MQPCSCCWKGKYSSGHWRPSCFHLIVYWQWDEHVARVQFVYLLSLTLLKCCYCSQDARKGPTLLWTVYVCSFLCACSIFVVQLGYWNLFLCTYACSERYCTSSFLCKNKTLFTVLFRQHQMLKNELKFISTSSTSKTVKIGNIP